jgi:hypothetical protein
MLFTFEVLQANHGDCLLLHFGTKTKPKLMVIDGGPDKIYVNHLKPRLLAIKKKRSAGKPLPIDMVMISHLDDDHANGICALLEEMVSDGTGSPFNISHLWVNTFDDILGNNQLPSVASIAASAAPASVASLQLPGINKKLTEDEIAVVASTSQGRQLRDNAVTLSLAVNKPFTKITGSDAVLVRGNTVKSKVPFSGLTMTVVSPDETRLKKLQTQWDKDLKRFKKSGDKSVIVASLASPDSSPFNLSSIVCLVESDGKKILLTGDGRSDFALEGLKNAGLLNAKGKLHVDILKMPHHGSIRNMKQEFLEHVTADHYVISADGRDDNPDKDLLNLLVKTVSKGTIYLTNETGKKGLKPKLDAFAKKINSSGSKLKIKFLPPGDSSFRIELGDKINF